MYPKAISWIIDRFCNLKCGHCYVDPDVKPMAKRIQNEEIKRACESISTITPEGIIVSGGEPLLCPDLFSYLKEARKVAGKIWICSNGTVITRDLLGKIRDFGVKGFSISLENPRDYINDQVRGQGSAGKIMAAISLLQEFGFDVIIDVTLQRYNINDIELFFDFLSRHNIGSITFTRFRPIGRGSGNESRFSYNRDRHKEVLERILSCAIRSKDRVKVSVHDPLYEVVVSDYCSKNGLESDSLISSRVSGCRAGTFWLGIGPNGDVSPCPLLLSGVVVGNILDKSLQEIIDRSELFQTIQQRRQGRNGCKNMSICGCCLAHTYSRTQSLFTKDPMCWIKGGNW